MKLLVISVAPSAKDRGGILSTGHENWAVCLECEHLHVYNIGAVGMSYFAPFDIILFDLNSNSLPSFLTLKTIFPNKIYIGLQEGDPRSYFTKSVSEQLVIFESLNKFDAIFAHTRESLQIFEAMVPTRPIYLVPLPFPTKEFFDGRFKETPLEKKQNSVLIGVAHDDGPVTAGPSLTEFLFAARLKKLSVTIALRSECDIQVISFYRKYLPFLKNVGVFVSLPEFEFIPFLAESRYLLYLNHRYCANRYARDCAAVGTIFIGSPTGVDILFPNSAVENLDYNILEDIITKYEENPQLYIEDIKYAKQKLLENYSYNVIREKIFNIISTLIK